MVEREREERWYTDPFGRHDARWISDGTPTKFVRHDGVDPYGEPPDEERMAEAGEFGASTVGSDLLSASDPREAQ